MNLVNLAQTLKMASNPNAALQSMIGQNPIIAKALEMTKGKNETEIMQIAQNLAKSQGVDFNQFQQNVMRQIGM